MWCKTPESDWICYSGHTPNHSKQLTWFNKTCETNQWSVLPLFCLSLKRRWLSRGRKALSKTQGIQVMKWKSTVKQKEGKEIELFVVKIPEKTDSFSLLSSLVRQTLFVSCDHSADWSKKTGNENLSAVFMRRVPAMEQDLQTLCFLSQSSTACFIFAHSQTGLF